MNTMYEQMNKYGLNAYETLKQLYAINTSLAEQLIEQQFALGTLAIEYSTKQMKLASTAKGYKELLSAQTEIAGEMSSKVQGIARNTLDIMSETKDEIGAWFEKSMKDAEKGLKEAAKVVPVAKAA